ncbi:Hypothetical_protein [Hexamita inflata]|uniref:Hypothetical_protein n=1 Tax=Hexamita inflata TaxID=28002 RepID=A0ABP1H6M9_9EUKA
MPINIKAALILNSDFVIVQQSFFDDSNTAKMIQDVTKLQKLKGQQICNFQQVKTKYGYQIMISAYSAMVDAQPYPYYMVSIYDDSFNSQVVREFLAHLQNTYVTESTLKSVKKSKVDKNFDKVANQVVVSHEGGTALNQVQVELAAVKSQIGQNIDAIQRQTERALVVENDAADLREVAEQFNMSTKRGCCM